MGFPAKPVSVEDVRKFVCEALIQKGVSPITTTVTAKKNHDQDKVTEISEKLMENPELAKLIGGLSTSTDDASDLVKGLL